MRSFKPLSVIVCYFLLGGAIVAADSPYVSEESDSIYGKGVHAFFDRDYKEAVTILSKAEEIKNNDPRPSYFLGLAHLRQKKTETAEQYFKKAAQLEFSGHTLRDYAVSESLRRIQGTERMRIEEIREEERANALVREQRLREMRYGRENTVIRDNLQQITSPHRNEDRHNVDLALPAAGGFGENAFGVKPIDPINRTAENIVTRRAETNPFGEVIVNTATETEIPVATTVSRNQETAAPLPKRTFVNPDLAGDLQKPVQSSTAASPNPVRSVQAAAAKELGRAMGTLFSGKAGPE